MQALTMRIGVPAGDAPEFESRFIDHLCTAFADVFGLVSAELEFPRDGQARHAVVPEFGFREQDGAWNQ
ncbi:hypothetical protein BLJ79_00950 [Arthrobacter sp. UCD-GKA]|uniref:hypothetical protein n=1 Tax=Arthrobacter sp. UCD-GKA TaxID=1913576 RepID=UPI0008DE9FB3|nr:hypothetical protein [Arthrobacter sp. UCD-GKA]OIH86569.1 hypothetical protein BLJ79_00950 [Arthrobacter sp. UCD-GKA]